MEVILHRTQRRQLKLTQQLAKGLVEWVLCRLHTHRRVQGVTATLFGEVPPVGA
jgi:hypothetical protein